MSLIDHVDVIDYTTDGRCSGCGQCCSSILPLSLREVERIHMYCRTHRLEPQKRAVVNGVDLSCPFRDEVGRKCLIYPVRPEICRAFQCNQTVEEIRQQKRLFHATRNTVFLRSEFFGDTSDFDALSAAFRVIVAEMGKK